MSGYDVVIVGAGSAGAPLAARLSEDPDRRVLLVEAGPVHDLPPEARDGSTLRAAVPGHPLAWSYPARLMPGRPYTIARGRVAGGSSAINGGSFLRARPADFDAWAAATRDDRWRYRNVLPVLRALEDDLDFGETEIHGGSGPMPVSRTGRTHPISAAFHDAALARGFADEPDKNAPGHPGIGDLPRNVVDGVRHSTAMQYLDPVRDRANLTVRGSAPVTRVRFDGARATGVELADDLVDADEVVLSAGAVGSAQLLLASGVGPADDLRTEGVTLVADAPVGRGFSDHPNLMLGWRGSDDTAPGTESFTSALSFGSSADRDEADLEIMLCVRSLAALLTGHGDPHERLLVVGLQDPDARGDLTLASGHPAHPPRIRYGYLKSGRDRERLRLAVRTAADLLRAAPFDGLFERFTELDEQTLTSDAALDGWVRSHLGTALHMCGTARMGAPDDPDAVVDSGGRVFGVTGLRVADTSILPSAPSRGPAATAVLIGELMARSIRNGG